MSWHKKGLKEKTCLQLLDSSDFFTKNNPFQSHFWGSVKKASGWKPLYFLYYPESGKQDRGYPFLVLEKRLFHILPIFYIPFGPDIFEKKQYNSPGISTTFDTEAITAIGKALRKWISPFSIFIRFDLPWGVMLSLEAHKPAEEKSGKILADLRICPYAIQPEATYQIDLQQSLDMLFSNFRTRCRRYIKKGIEQLIIRDWNGDKHTAESWYNLYCHTAERDGFSPRSKHYINTLLELGKDKREDVKVVLFLAYKDAEMRGGIIVMYTEQEGVYLLGASRIDKNIPSSSYLLQWHAIQFLKKQGCITYDLFGVPKMNSSDTHLAGLELFKSSFGGKYIEREKSIDVIGCKPLYHLYSFLEQIRITSARKNSS